MTDHAITAANRLGLDYAAEAERMPAPVPIIDVHTHITGPRAARVYARVAQLYGVSMTYSMTQLAHLDTVREAMGGRIRFIAVPNHRSDDLKHAVTDGFLEQIEAFHARGERLIKIWAAPRGRDIGDEKGFPSAFRFEAPHNRAAMELAARLGMVIMVHIGDPDTWFATKYADVARYGTKKDQYAPFEAALDAVATPFIAAHLGGWPEDLEFLAGLLERHPNLHLDTSATKWMVREVSRHEREAVMEFLTRWSGRILFGSDIVASDEHLGYAGEGDPPVAQISGTEDEIFDLYASRYWALRVMWEQDYAGASPIADPDLALVDPKRHDEMDAPTLRGKRLPVELLRVLYHDAAEALLGPPYEQGSSE